MNYEELKKKLDNKQLDNERRKEITWKAFEAIKDDCLKLVIEKTISCNFKYGVDLYDRDIIDLVCSKLNYNTQGNKFSSRFGIGNDLYQDFSMLHHQDLGKQDDDAERLLQDIDYAKLSVWVCNYIKSKGFTSRKVTHRFTGERLELMEFTIGERSLRNLMHSEENRSSSGEVNKLPRSLEDGRDERLVALWTVLGIILISAIIVFSVK